MTEPEEERDAELELTEVSVWEQPALVLRIVYDEQGRINTVMTEYRDAPSADDVARVVAQFLSIKPGGLPQRDPRASLPRDPALERKFLEVLGACTAIANVLDPVPGSHANHACNRRGDHLGAHRCDCGISFGG